MYPACPENILKKQTLVEFFWSKSILGLWGKCFRILVVFLQTCPSRFLTVETNVLMIFFGKKSFFSVSGWNVFWRSEKNREKLSKLISTCSENQLTKHIFSIFLMFLIHTRTSWELFSDFWQKKFPVIFSKLLSTRSRCTVGWKISFFEKLFSVWLPNFERSCFWLSAKLLQRCCQNYSLRVQETNWRNRFFTKFLVFMYILTSSETFFDFWKFFFANLSKPLFMSSDKLFDAKITLR